MSRIVARVPRPAILPDDADLAARALGIGPNDRVLEIGGAANAFRRANVVCDLTFGGTRQRNGAPGVFRAGVSYVEASAEALPFDDGAFDFVWCTQVLEHVKDPAKAAAEMSRVARRGFVEVPSRTGEALNGNPTHRWVVDREGTTLVFRPRTFVEHPFDHLFYGAIFRDEDLRRRSETDLRGELNHQIVFEGRLSVRVEPPAEGETAFDYDDPAQAARAHYHFARCCLRDGVDPIYALVDAQTAATLLPRSGAARRLAAAFSARLRLFDDALARLDGLTDAASATMRRVVLAASTGDAAAFAAIPIPGPMAAAEAATPASPRPLISTIVPAEDARGVRDAVEGALTQDYENLEVVVVATRPAETRKALEGLEGVGRLKIVDAPGTTGGALLNAAFGACRGEMFMCALPGDRFFASHADRLIATVLAGGVDGAFSDFVEASSGAAIDGGIDDGRGTVAPTSLGGLLATQAAFLRTGPFETDRADAAARWMTRLAAASKLARVPSATYVSSRPRPSGAATIDGARVAARLDPCELLRELTSLHTRLDAANRRAVEPSDGTT